MKSVIKIKLGKHTVVFRKVDAQEENPTVSLFGMYYTLEELVDEGWSYEILYNRFHTTPSSYRS